MKKRLIYFILIIVSVLFIGSCESDNENKTENAIDTVIPVAINENEVIVDENIAESGSDIFIFEPAGMSDYDAELTDVFVEFNEKKTKLATLPGGVQTFEKDEFLSMGIPEDATAACGAWWAGSGEYYYLYQNETGIVVYKGWQDEMQEDEGYHWEKNIELK